MSFTRAAKPLKMRPRFSAGETVRSHNGFFRNLVSRAAPPQKIRALPWGAAAMHLSRLIQVSVNLCE